MGFPSPYGVSFILIYKKRNFISYEEFVVSVSLRSIIHSYFLITGRVLKTDEIEFPSPYGVSFILIQKFDIGCKDKNIVSVSLRSIIHSYLEL